MQILFQRYFLDCHFELSGKNYMKIITTGQIFILNYNLSRISKQPSKFVCYYFLWGKFKLKFEILQNFKL
jgi:hypothetical protein